MAEENTVAEQESDAAPEGVANVEAGAQEEESLDQLLASFDADGGSETESEQPKSELEALTRQVEQITERAAVQEHRETMTSVVADIRGDLDPNVFDDTMIEGYINAEAMRRPQLQTAWKNRDQNPDAFRKVMKTIGKEFQGKFSQLPDRKVTEDVEAVKTAVRGASTSAPGPSDDVPSVTDMLAMSDGAREQAINKLIKG